MNKKKLEQAYNEMLRQYPEGQIIEEKINCYICDNCDHITKTQSINNGVIPFLHECEKCNSIARSTFFIDIMPEQEPTQEWFRPSLEEISHKNYPQSMLSHVLWGGLDIRKIKK